VIATLEFLRDHLDALMRSLFAATFLVGAPLLGKLCARMLSWRSQP